jgi:predicted transcriptional regulator
MISAFEWTSERNKAAIALAEGKTQDEAATEAGVTDRTVRNWLQDEVFAAEVDRLSLMIGVASRAERLRLAKRVVRQMTLGNTVKTDKDLLEWLKFAQSETDGIKLDLTKLAALGADETPVADSGSDRVPSEVLH